MGHSHCHHKTAYLKSLQGDNFISFGFLYHTNNRWTQAITFRMCPEKKLQEVGGQLRNWTGVTTANWHTYSQASASTLAVGEFLWPINYTTIKLLKNMLVIHKVRFFRFPALFRWLFQAFVSPARQCCSTTPFPSKRKDFSTLAPWSFGASSLFVVGGCLCVVGCLATSLASAH